MPDDKKVEPDIFDGLDSRRRELIDAAQMKALPIWMQKMRRTIKEAWKERDEGAEDERG